MTFTTYQQVLAEHAARHPDRPVAIVDDVAITWADVRVHAGRVSELFAASASRQPPRVALKVDDAARFIGVFLGLVAAGCAAVPLPGRVNRAAMAAILRDCEPDAVIVSAEEVAEYRAFGCPVHAVESLPHAVGHDRRSGLPTLRSARPDDELMIAYSSGTTSTPKGVIHTHGTLCHAALTAIEHYRMDRDERMLIAAPLYTARALCPLLATAFAGGTSIVVGDFEPDRFIDTIVSHSPTIVDLVPTQFAMLLDHPRFDAERLSRCRFVLCGGAASEPRLRDRLYALFPSSYIEAYGSTETVLVSRLPRRAAPDKRGSVGLPRVEIRILDEDEAVLERGAVGEIAVCSPANTPGYLGKPDESAAAFWTEPGSGKRLFRTGDLGYLDDDGYLWLSGRKKDMIITGGFNVYPTDIEQVLQQHPLIREAAVVGMPHDSLGEVAVAFLALDRKAPDPAAVTTQAREWANARLDSRQKLYRVHVVDALPRNASGKVLKSELRRTAEAWGRGSEPEGRGPLATGANDALTRTEAAVASIWKMVLATDRLGLRDDFFARGATSLEAYLACSEIMESLGVQLDLADIYGHPNVAALAKAIDDRARASVG